MNTFHVDTTQITAFARQEANAAPVLRRNMAKAGRQAGFIVEGAAKVEAPVGKPVGGNLKNLIRADTPRQSGLNTTVTVTSHAEYSRPVHDGRKAVVRTQAQGPLVWEGPNGTVFTMKTKAVAANPYMDRGLQKSEAQVQQAFDRALSDAMRELGF